MLDTSVLINLNASGKPEEILQVLPYKFLIADIVVSEVGWDKREHRDDASLLKALVDKEAVECSGLSNKGFIAYEELVSGQCDTTLGDGESATIALAYESEAIPILDDKKAYKVFCQRYPQKKCATTIDLLSHQAVIDKYEHDELSELVYRALVGARMAVREDQLDWVLQLIGDQRAKRCRSLPRFKKIG